MDVAAAAEAAAAEAAAAEAAAAEAAAAEAAEEVELETEEEVELKEETEEEAEVEVKAVEEQEDLPSSPEPTFEEAEVEDPLENLMLPQGSVQSSDRTAAPLNPLGGPAINTQKKAATSTPTVTSWQPPAPQEKKKSRFAGIFRH